MHKSFIQSDTLCQSPEGKPHSSLFVVSTNQSSCSLFCDGSLGSPMAATPFSYPDGNMSYHPLSSTMYYKSPIPSSSDISSGSPPYVGGTKGFTTFSSGDKQFGSFNSPTQLQYTHAPNTSSRSIRKKSTPTEVTVKMMNNVLADDNSDFEFVKVFDTGFQNLLTVPREAVRQFPPPKKNITRWVMCRNYIEGLKKLEKEAVGSDSTSRTDVRPSESDAEGSSDLSSVKGCTMGPRCNFVHVDYEPYKSVIKSHPVHINYVWAKQEDCTYDTLPPGNQIKVFKKITNKEESKSSFESFVIDSGLIIKTAAFPDEIQESISSLNGTDSLPKTSSAESVEEKNLPGDENEQIRRQCEFFHGYSYCPFASECKDVHIMHIDPNKNSSDHKWVRPKVKINKKTGTAPASLFNGNAVCSLPQNRRIPMEHVSPGGSLDFSLGTSSSQLSNTQSVRHAVMPFSTNHNIAVNPSFYTTQIAATTQPQLPENHGIGSKSHLTSFNSASQMNDRRSYEHFLNPSCYNYGCVVLQQQQLRAHAPEQQALISHPPTQTHIHQDQANLPQSFVHNSFSSSPPPSNSLSNSQNFFPGVASNLSYLPMEHQPGVAIPMTVNTAACSDDDEDILKMLHRVKDEQIQDQDSDDG